MTAEFQNVCLKQILNAFSGSPSLTPPQQKSRIVLLAKQIHMFGFGKAKAKSEGDLMADLGTCVRFIDASSELDKVHDKAVLDISKVILSVKERISRMGEGEPDLDMLRGLAQGLVAEDRLLFVICNLGRLEFEVR